MVLTVLAVSLFALSSTCRAHNNDYVITAPYGSTPTIDGVIGVEEWQDANSITMKSYIALGEYHLVTVYIKNDGIALYMAFDFLDPDDAGGMDRIHIAFDTAHDDGTILHSDDMLFEIGRDRFPREYFGDGTPENPGKWSIREPSGWTFQLTNEPSGWKAEFAFPYVKLELLTNTERVIGGMFWTHDFLDPWTWHGHGISQWPFSWDWVLSGHPNDPSTWGDIIIACAPNPLDALEDLIETIEAWNLPKGTENSLTTMLKRALYSLDNDRESVAIKQLEAFINYVDALKDKKLTDEQADYLIAEAQRIIDLIRG